MLSSSCTLTGEGKCTSARTRQRSCLEADSDSKPFSRADAGIDDLGSTCGRGAALSRLFHAGCGRSRIQDVEAALQLWGGRIPARADVGDGRLP